ncbi:NUDIX hydrolase [Legionella worsleiensis]|uniref:MutT/nudix family transporter protein n=1 Tax=Legionella worsleiensis TaxID=45076 RepID=A0A0W1AJM8_9GAMM|nr:CoA pyrophosphatase [Legionella worsleiensis]KTD81416.1 MutT/nudix family transporter protein [Legionella worsleiensis]STY30096.1 MutT/nudix family transporter protein [Legionella worsleiensis]
MDLNNFLTKEGVHSAVLVLYESSTDSLLLTKRSEGLKNHPGEISFPGGLCDEEDQSYADTALRELEEELGISRERVQLIRALNEERTLSGIVIHPWLGQIESREPFNINTAEVAELIAVPMPLVRSVHNYRNIIVYRYGIKFTTCEFIAQDQFIWGATARIMKQLAVDSLNCTNP